LHEASRKICFQRKHLKTFSVKIEPVWNKYFYSKSDSFLFNFFSKVFLMVPTNLYLTSVQFSSDNSSSSLPAWLNLVTQQRKAKKIIFSFNTHALFKKQLLTDPKVTLIFFSFTLLCALLTWMYRKSGTN
jgi:hypothetical protein